MNYIQYEYHPLANYFPLLDDVSQEYKDLVEDIREFGMHMPIWLYEGKILDGRNRYRACMDAGRPHVFKEYAGVEPLAFVFSLNMTRRQLTSSQIAAIVYKARDALREEAKRRQLAGLKHVGRHMKDDVSLASNDANDEREGKTSYQLAKMTSGGTSGAQIERIARLDRLGRPDLINDVEAGLLSAEAAVQEATKETRAETPRPELPEKVAKLQSALAAGGEDAITYAAWIDAWWWGFQNLLRWHTSGILSNEDRGVVKRDLKRIVQEAWDGARAVGGIDWPEFDKVYDRMDIIKEICDGREDNESDGGF